MYRKYLSVKTPLEFELAFNDTAVHRFSHYTTRKLSSRYMDTYHPSRKLSKLDEPDMQDTAGEVGTSS